IRIVKESLRAVPRGGVGYGVLRYLRRHPEFTAERSPEIGFNYLGQFDEAAVQAPFTAEPDKVGATAHPSTDPGFAVELNALAIGGQVEVSLSYGCWRLSEQAARQLMKRLEGEIERAVAHCMDKAAPELTPSDLTYRELSVADLDGI